MRTITIGCALLASVLAWGQPAVRLPGSGTAQKAIVQSADDALQTPLLSEKRITKAGVNDQLVTLPAPTVPLRKVAAHADGADDMPLVVVTAGSTLPDSFSQWETGTFDVELRNTGTTDFNGDYMWMLLGLEADTIAYMDGSYNSARVAAGSSTRVGLNYNVADAAPGTYRLTICSIELVEQDGILYLGDYAPIPFDDGTTGKTVQVLAAEQPQLAFDEASVVFPDTLPGSSTPNSLLWGGDYTVRPYLTNTGGDFDGLVYAVLLRLNADGTQYQLYHMSTPVPVQLAKGETKRFAFNGTVETALSVGYYFFALMTEDYSIIPTTEYTLPYTFVIYPLTILTEGSSLPATMRQHEDATLTLRLRNEASADIDDIVYMYAGSNLSFAGSVQAFIPARGEADITIPYNLGDCPAGEQALQFFYTGNFVDGVTSYLWDIGWDDGTTTRTVQVEGNEGPALQWLAEQSTLPTEVTMHQPFSAPVTLTNTGADFNGEVSLILYGSDYLIRYRSDAAQVSLARGETKQVTITGAVDLPTSLPRPVAYYVDVAYYTNGGVEVVPSDDGSIRIVTVHPDPATTPVLTWLTQQTDLLATFAAGQSYYLTIPIQNAGQADYTGDVALTFLDGNTFSPKYSWRLTNATLAGQSTSELPYSIMLPADMEVGTYALQINLLEGNSIVSYVPTEDLRSYFYPVTVESPATGLAQTEAGCALYPNPATDYVVVTDEAGITHLRLYAPDGTLLLDEPCNGHATHRLDLGTLPPGVYLLTVTTPEGIRTERVAKR